MIVATHLGAGDALICQGLIRELAKQHDVISIPCWPHNVATLRHMYEDLDNVKFMVVNTQDEMLNLVQRNGAIKLGMYAGEAWEVLRWDQEFYRQAAVDFDHRWASFQIPNLPEVGPVGTYNFLHHDIKRGFIADRYDAPEHTMTVIPTGYLSIFDYVPYMKSAKEIHCIDGPFLCLADSLPQRNGQRLFCHKYARNSVLPTLRREWKVLT